MIFKKENIHHTLNGILFVVLFSLAAMQISDIAIIKQWGLSPLVLGILLGMLYANTLRAHLPTEWVPGILFSSKTILRLAVIFYGFRITFQQIQAVGLQGLTLSLIMVSTTFVLGAFIGQKILKMDRDTTLLTTAGSSVCGAAAVLATEPVLKAEPYKSVIAVGTVVMFGTTSMFLYPVLYRAGILHMSPETFGLYVGGTVHEVAHVVGASSAVGPEAAKVAVIVKMTRVMLIAPLLIILGIILSALGKKRGEAGANVKLVIPWFAVLFIVMSGINSLGIIPQVIVGGINKVDTFMLTMAMTALGMETNTAKFKQAGIRPVLLALILFIWLIFGGYAITTFISSLQF